jgi:hypothetical protein
MFSFNLFLAQTVFLVFLADVLFAVAAIREKKTVAEALSECASFVFKRSTDEL